MESLSTVLVDDDSNRNWDPGIDNSGSQIEIATVPERILPHIISSVGEDDDASMTDADNIVSRTEFDSHANMMVVGKHAYILNVSGRKARVQPYSPNYAPQEIPIVDACCCYVRVSL